MTATERNTNNELTRLIVALVLLSASLAAWADMAVFTNYTYDAVGQLVGTASGYGTDGAAKMTRDYAYDLHGWPVKLDTKVTRGMVPVPTGPAVISPEYYAEAGVTKAAPQLGNLFKERISYAGGKYPRYNGTPSARELGSGRYDYRYDALDRLTAAEFTPVAGSNADFSTAYTYDVLSRPKTIKRYGVVDVSGLTETFGVLDCMHMEYDGAHLTAVTSEVDAVEGRDFYGRTGYADGTYKDRVTRSYNAAGRLTSDGGAMLGSVRYNTLGLPTMMSIATSSPEKAPRKERVYDATGCKLRQRETEYPGGVATLTEDHRYVGHFTFSADSLERMDFDGGYFDSAGKAHFLFTDWQGNVTLDVDADGNIDQQISYYPYGEPWREPKGQRQTLFAAKERQRGQLAGTYDFGPRGFNPVFLSWDSHDSKSSDYPWWSPWVYCGSNPIRNIDPSGDDVFIFNDKAELVEQIVNDEIDQVQIKAGDDIIKGKEYKKGTLSHKTISVKSAEGKTIKKLDYFKILGDDNATEIFEFMADNYTGTTNPIEWGLIRSGEKGSYGKNYVGTSRDAATELFSRAKIANLKDKNVRALIHSHPERTRQPSGLSDNTGDIGFAKFVTKKIAPTALFYIYLPNTENAKKQYIFYDSNSKAGDLF